MTPRCLWSYCVSDLAPTVRDMAGFFGPAQPGRLLRLLRSRRRGGGRAGHVPSGPARDPDGRRMGGTSCFGLPSPSLLSLLCFGAVARERCIAGPAPRSGYTVLRLAAAARARARGLRTVGTHLGVSVRIELRHGSLSSPPARPVGGTAARAGRTRHPLAGSRPMPMGGDVIAAPGGRGGACKLRSIRRVCGCCACQW